MVNIPKSTNENATKQKPAESNGTTIICTAVNRIHFGLPIATCEVHLGSGIAQDFTETRCVSFVSALAVFLPKRSFLSKIRLFLQRFLLHIFRNKK